ncbi:MAG TPA: LuxR C-terminal-related transcriptional regulator [Actinomycetes bacterium]|nr:LuxR C-terminal-related transcriptional regulator [Actinomycetes bacterium]
MKGAAGRRPGEVAGMPLLASKLVVPSMPGRVVERPRLFKLLDTGVERPVTLVAAPAGSGKTLLLTSWISAASPPGEVAWLSLDRGDNDPVRFWAYVLAALGRSGAVPADSGLRAVQPSPADDDALLASLLHGLEELASPVVLVLDDVHELTEPRVLSGLDFLIRYAPPQLRLVLSTRADPPLALHRLLVSGQLTQLRVADLAFTVPEVDQLLAGYDYRPRLSDDDLAALQARTEGWAAGLRLAAVSMQHQPDLHRFVMELAGDDRSLAGYLVSEVLEQQPAELRSFLLRTCVVGELSGELADALTGRDDGERILARLERANAFVMALGSRHKWYRYHPLFAELLRYQLRREAPHEVVELRHRAARWYAGHGLPVEAVQQAATVRDWGYAAELIAEHGLGRALRGQGEAFRDLLDLLPADLVRLDPELALLLAAQRIADDDGAEASLQLAREQLPLLAAERRPRFALVLATCRLLRAGRAGDLDELLASGGEALAAHEQLDAAGAGGMAAAARAVALAGLGTAELWTGALDAAEDHLQAGQAAAMGAGLDDLQLDCLSRLALLQAIGGRLSLAARSGEVAIGLAGDAPAVAGALLALAWVHYQRDDLLLAGSFLERAAEQAGGAADRPLRAAVRLLRGRLRWAEGDPAGALAELGAARRELGDWGPPGLLTRWLSTTEAELRLAAGDAGPATALLGSFGTGEPVEEPEAVARAGLQLALDDPAAALGTLSPFLDAAGPGTRLDTSIRAWLLHALASQALDQADQAAASLRQAIGLAEPEEHRRTFLDAGAAGQALVVRYRDWIDVSWPFLDELALASLDPAPAVMSPMPVLIETLSERERAVLRYLPTMLTFVEIGSELYISVNTTKSHVRNIYRKLGVVGRRDAVRRARQLQLLRS